MPAGFESQIQPQMKLIEFIRRIFRKDKNRPDLYAKAIAEGIKDAVAELGYSMGLDNKP